MSEDRTWLPLDLREALKGCPQGAWDKVREWYWRSQDFAKRLQEERDKYRAYYNDARRDYEAHIHRILDAEEEREAVELRAQIDAKARELAHEVLDEVEAPGSRNGDPWERIRKLAGQRDNWQRGQKTAQEKLNERENTLGIAASILSVDSVADVLEGIRKTKHERDEAVRRLEALRGDIRRLGTAYKERPHAVFYGFIVAQELGRILSETSHDSDDEPQAATSTDDPQQLTRRVRRNEERIERVERGHNRLKDVLYQYADTFAQGLRNGPFAWLRDALDTEGDDAE